MLILDVKSTFTKAKMAVLKFFMHVCRGFEVTSNKIGLLEKTKYFKQKFK